MKCWASSRGDCAGSQSGEHVFSKSLFSGRRVKVSGSPYSADGLVEIGLAGLTANILCQHHNTELSALDSAAKEFSALLTDVWDKEKVRVKTRATGKISRLKPLNHRFSGFDLERWFLKTSINLAYVSPTVDTIAGSDVLNPSEWMLESIFDAVPPQRPIGLYAAVNLDRGTDAGNAFAFSEVRNSQDLVGGLFVFRMLRFVVWLEQVRPPKVEVIYPDWNGWTMLGPQPDGFNIDSAPDVRSQSVRYDWP